MKSKIHTLAFFALPLVPISASAQLLFSWETDTEGWVGTEGNPEVTGDECSIAVSTIGATDGSQSLAVTCPMGVTDGWHGMWYSVPTSASLSVEQLQATFEGATELKLDVSYPDPGYNSWVSPPSVEIIIQGEFQGWTGLGAQEIEVGAEPVTLTFPLTVAQAHNMATSGWGQMLLKFTYGNGGTSTAATEVVFYVDNIRHTVVADPSPVPDLFWTGEVDEMWTSLNWTTDEAGAGGGGALPTDGSSLVAFAATTANDHLNFATVLGAAQNIRGLLAKDDFGPIGISGSHDLTLGADGIWVEENSFGMDIDTTGNVVLAADQVWKIKSSSPVTVESVISGTGQLTKSGAGSLFLAQANSYSGGTVVEQGGVIFENVLALGPAGSSLNVTGGSVDLNGYSPTFGDLAGTNGGLIHNTSFSPSVLTIDSDDDIAYGCTISDGSEDGTISLVKSGLGNAVSTGGGNFTGDVTITEGQFTAQTTAWGVPTWTSLGNAQHAGRTIHVESGATLLFGSSRVFGNQTGDSDLLPTILVNEGTMEVGAYNIIGDLTLNAGTLSNASMDMGENQGIQFRGDVLVTGTAPSIVADAGGSGCHLGPDTIFNVEDVTGDGDADLEVAVTLIDQSGEFGMAPGSLTKAGAGTMFVSMVPTYSGNTTVEAGTLSLWEPGLSDTGTLSVAAGAVLHLDFFESSEEDIVGGLVLDGMTQDPGTYGPTGSGAEHETPFITGIGLIVVSDVVDPFVEWMTTNYPGLTGADAERGADPDGDGHTNLEEFAFNSDPTSALDGLASGKFRSGLADLTPGTGLVLTFPVRDGAIFSGTGPAVATLGAEGLTYTVGGSNDLATFDQAVSEVVPALSSELPVLDEGWSYRTFRLDGDVGGESPRGPLGFLRASAVESP